MLLHPLQCPGWCPHNKQFSSPNCHWCQGVRVPSKPLVNEQPRLCVYASCVSSRKGVDSCSPNLTEMGSAEDR